MPAVDTDWVFDAVSRIEADFTRSADTHLIRVEFPGSPGLRLYLKDESIHPTGSLKHRLARSLFLYGLCNGWIQHDTTIVESSSGNTAVSEAYFARLLGLPFIAVVPHGTSPEKLEQIEHYGGRCHPVSPCEIYAEARNLAAGLNGHYMDQFTYAERATDWRGNNNIAESIFQQMSREPDPVPHWVVMSAGTGGTSATIGRFIRYQRLATRLCVPDPEHSVFYDHFTSGTHPDTPPPASRIEGIGRPRVEPSFLPSVVDRMYRVPDAASVAGIRFLEALLHRRYGGSTGTHLWAALQLLSEMKSADETGSVVTLICDGGERYRATYYSDDWLQAQGLDVEPYLERLWRFHDTGVLCAPRCGKPGSLTDLP